jgi:hypothetical protein
MRKKKIVEGRTKEKEKRERMGVWARGKRDSRSDRALPAADRGIGFSEEAQGFMGFSA